ncbi:hypothetical protein PR048_002833 [Dryococelus australis]|uniref:Uncharacterized protein n=1 Tax=Dryococelus australis TaxID=614101 RepID=A0ABQ9IMD2_9NEOP|nr:hypothetical protein PR048_002833 [Dryococelus australis]
MYIILLYFYSGLIPSGVAPEFSHARIVSDDAAGRRVISGISRFPRPSISVLLHTHLVSPALVLKISMFKAAHLSPLLTLLEEIDDSNLCKSSIKYLLIVRPPVSKTRKMVSYSAPSETSPRRVSRAVWLLASHQGESGSIPGRFTSDFCKWESCRTMPLVGGFSRGSPFAPPYNSGAAPYSPRFTLIGSQDLAVKSRSNLHSLSYL